MKPMSQEEALRIIHNVAEHNTHNSPAQVERVNQAVGRAAWDLDERMRLVQQMLEVYAVVGAMGEMIKKQVYHQHSPNRLDALHAIAQANEQLYLLEALWMMTMPPAPKTLLGIDGDAQENGR